ncbi:MAG TPA: hypothetical protein PKH24_14875 [Sedimentisphaerales bacterium]|jgi:hypothetical protein|nr:hypothetical protein [Sedimentisphaerales bacterium]HNU30386.1 hypothetical protein [Sedimentisphaerales bacterium]
MTREQLLGRISIDLEDEKRTAGHRWEFILGYLSIASLLGGLILGALGLVL